MGKQESAPRDDRSIGRKGLCFAYPQVPENASHVSERTSEVVEIKTTITWDGNSQ